MDANPEIRLWPDTITYEELVAELERRDEIERQKIAAARLVKEEFEMKVWPKKKLHKHLVPLTPILVCLCALFFIGLGLYPALVSGEHNAAHQLVNDHPVSFLLAFFVLVLVSVMATSGYYSRRDRKTRMQFVEAHPTEAKLLGYIE